VGAGATPLRVVGNRGLEDVIRNRPDYERLALGGSALNMIPATSGTSALIRSFDPERQYVLTVIGYAVVVDAAWKEGGVVRQRWY
jgi:hypothetical protein